MNPYFEKIASGPLSFVAYERNDPAFPFYWHYHPEYELTLIVDSRGQRLVGDSISDYGPGDLVLLGPNLPHSWRSGPVVSSCAEERHRAVVVQFRGDFLGERFFQMKELETVIKLLCRSEAGLAFGDTVTGKKVADSLADLLSLSAPKRLVALLAALVDLAEEKQARLLSSTRLTPISRPGDQRRIDEICMYLNEQFAEEIDFSGLSRRFGMDQACLCRFFKRATGRTMTRYVNELRVGAATQMLISSKRNVLEICFSVGFGNYSNFSRQFKQIKGIGPQTLRRQFSTLA